MAPKVTVVTKSDADIKVSSSECKRWARGPDRRNKKRVIDGKGDRIGLCSSRVGEWRAQCVCCSNPHWQITEWRSVIISLIGGLPQEGDREEEERVRKGGRREERNGEGWQVSLLEKWSNSKEKGREGRKEAGKREKWGSDRDTVAHKGTEQTQRGTEGQGREKDGWHFFVCMIRQHKSKAKSCSLGMG